MRRALLICALFLTFAAVAAPTAGATRVLPASATPMNMSLDLWVIAYTRAGGKRSAASDNALFTVNGGKCGFARGKVWFLPDVWRDAQLETSCVIPRGKLVLVPAANLVLPALRKLLDLRADGTVRSWIASSNVAIDGRSVGPGHWVSTPVFGTWVGYRNFFHAPPGFYTSFVDGYYALVALTPGQHTIVTTSAYNDPYFEAGYTYHLTVR